MTEVGKNLSQIQAQIRNLQNSSCKNPNISVRLIAVSKTVPISRMMEAYNEGQRDFGENKVQELSEKRPQMPADVCWHFIGRLQTNKVKYLFSDLSKNEGKVPFIHSVDRESLALEIEKTAAKNGLQHLPVLLQANVSGETTKAGFSEQALLDFLDKWPGNSRLRFEGLMTLAPLSEDRELIRKVFTSTRRLFETLKKEYPAFQWKYLSMGMSGDYAIAIEEGSTHLRIGSAIFGERKVNEAK